MYLDVRDRGTEDVVSRGVVGMVAWGTHRTNLGLVSQTFFVSGIFPEP